MADEIAVLTTGGTLDKIYFDAKSEFEVGSSIVGRLLEQAEARVPYRIVELLRKDSLDLTDADRQRIREAAESDPANRIVITHGTDTMTDTARSLAGIAGKTIVLTGALAPARFAQSDALFNLGMAFGAVQSLPPGIYIAMNGRIFDATRVRKDRARNEFVATDET
ncbi:MAG: asparaginase [Pseudomonadales bacterium]|nr:asparaginase [Pseudomonadales bacterium]